MKNGLIANLTAWKRVSLAIGKSVKSFFEESTVSRWKYLPVEKNYTSRNLTAWKRISLATGKSAKVAFQGATTFTG